MGVMDWVTETAGDVYDGAGDVYNGAAETAGELYDGAAETAGELYDGAAETAGDIYDGAGELYDGAAETAGELYDGASETVGELYDAGAEALGELYEGGKEVLGDGVDLAKELYEDIGDGVGKGVDWVYEKVDEMTSDSGLGSEVDEMVKKSPTLTKNLEDAKAAGFSVKYGEPGKGTFMDPNTKEIVIDPASKGDIPGIAQSLAHETGHALYTQDPEVGMEGLTKEEYVKRNAMRHLKDEGEATITNMKVREEILKATQDASGGGGTDIGVAGSQSAKYLELQKKYPDPKDRDKLREEIGKVFAKGETPSTDLNSNYEDYYGESYKKAWDKAHPK